MVDELVMISARIRKEDREFLRQRNIGITELIQTAIFHRRNEFEGFATNFEQERQKREAFQRKFSTALKFMDDKGLIDEWIAVDTAEREKQEKRGVIVNGH